MLSSRESNVDYRLRQWGIWARQDSTGLGVANPMGRLVGANPSGEFCEITDDEARLMDELVTKLSRRNGEVGRVLIMTYVQRTPQREIARQLRRSKTAVGVMIQNGLSWIDGALHEEG